VLEVEKHRKRFQKIPLDPPCLPVGRLLQRGMKEEEGRRK